MRAHAPPELRGLGERARLVEEADIVLVLLPVCERVRHAAAGEEAREDLRPGRVQARVHVLDEGRARGEGEDLGEEVAEPVRDRDRTVGAADADVHVQAEGVVAPDDVAQQLVVAAVVRRVDDPLLLPGRPGMRARGAEGEVHRFDERLQLSAALRHRGRDVGERLAATGLDLDLGRDQLTDEIGLERGAGCGRLHVLEAVDEIESGRIEERELLLDRDGEVRPLLEAVARRSEQLLVAEPLLVTHGGQGS